MEPGREADSRYMELAMEEVVLIWDDHIRRRSPTQKMRCLSAVCL